MNNEWAKRSREYLLKNGGKAVEILFPHSQLVEWMYDMLVLLLFLLAAVLGYKHAAFWQMSLSVAAFFIALFIALMNRDRFYRVRGKHKH